MEQLNFLHIDVEHVLNPLLIEHTRDPNPTNGHGQRVWQRFDSDRDQPVWHALPASKAYMARSFTRDEVPPFASGQYDSAIEAIRTFQASHACEVRLNGETGLPLLLYGDLYPVQQHRDNLATAVAFLQANQLAVTGRDRPLPLDEGGGAEETGVFLKGIQRLRWRDGTDQIRFQQYGPLDIPIYGAQVVTTFDATGRLAIVSSSLYPAVEKLPVHRGAMYQYDLMSDAISRQIPKHIGSKGMIRDNEGVDSRPTLWIYPYRTYQNASEFLEHVGIRGATWYRGEETHMWHFDLDTWLKSAGPRVGGRFVPAIKVRFKDQYESVWHAILDLTEPRQPTLIHFDLEERAAPYLLFTSAIQTADYFDALAQTGADPPTLVVDFELEHDLSFGNGSSFTDADGVKCVGQFVNPAVPPQPTTFAIPDTFRVPTVFYHLREAQYFFGLLVNQAQFDPPTSATTPLSEIIVEFDEQACTPSYSGGRIRIGRGYQAAGYHVKEPGLDPEVVVHEFTHAVVHFFFDNFFHVPNDVIVKRALDGFDESLAFYLSTVAFGDPQWSEYAYAAWSQYRNLDVPAGPFNWRGSQSDPFDAAHGLGIWLGRLFWEIHVQETLGRTVSYLLFKALGCLAPIGLSNQSPEANREEQLKGVLSLIAKAIYVQSDSADQQLVLQQVFSAAGLDAL